MIVMGSSPKLKVLPGKSFRLSALCMNMGYGLFPELEDLFFQLIDLFVFFLNFCLLLSEL